MSDGRNTRASSLVSVKFKLYHEYRFRGNEIEGTKRSAKNADYGYVYYYRLSGDQNSSSQLAHFSLSPGYVQTLAYEIAGKPARYFFFFSRIEISRKREEAISGDIKTFVDTRNSHNRSGGSKNIICRATHIPLTNQTDAYRYYNFSGIRDVDFPSSDTGNYVIIYLHDWYKYLENYNGEYQRFLNEYIDFNNDSVKLINYHMTDEHRRFRSSNAYADNRISNDTFIRGQLYVLTKEIEAIVAKKLKYQNNMRSHLEYGHEQYKKTNTDEGLIPVFDYGKFLNEYAGIKNRGRLLAEKIADLYAKDIHRSIHCTLFDYYYGSNEQINAVRTLVVESVRRNFEFLDMGSERWKAFEDFFLQNKGLIETRNYTGHTLEELHTIYGDNDIFWAVFNLTDVVDKGASITGVLFDTLKEYYDPDLFTRLIVSNRKYNGLFKPAGVVFIDESRINRWYAGHMSNRPKAEWAGTTADKMREWERYQIDKLSPLYKDVKIEKVTRDGRTTRYVNVSLLTEDPDALSRTAKVGSDVAYKLCAVFAAINIVSKIRAAQEGKNDLFSTVVSVSSSLAAITEKPLLDLFQGARSLNTRNTAGAMAGITGKTLMALESYLEAEKRMRAHDYDAAFFYGSSALLALLSVFTGSSELVVLSLITSFLGGMVTDTDVDVFLKYSVWGTNYKDVWAGNRTPILPSWWSFNDRALTGERNFVEREKVLFFPTEDDEDYKLELQYGLTPWDANSGRALENHRTLLNRLRQKTGFKLELTQNSLIWSLVMDRENMVIEVDLKDRIQFIDFIELQLFQKRPNDFSDDFYFKMHPIFPRPLLFPVKKPPDNVSPYSVVRNPYDYLLDKNEREIGMYENLDDAKRFSVHILPSKRTFEAVRSRTAYSSNMFIHKRTMFCDVFEYSKKTRVEVTLHFNQKSLLPIKLIGFYPDRQGVRGIQQR